MTITELRQDEYFRESADSERAVSLNAGDGTIDFGATIGDSLGNEAPWTDLAACRSVPGSADVFFSEDVADIVVAKGICSDCPVIAPCLEGALLRNEPCGVWGGQLFDDGKIIARKRRRGRPPKVPRPEDQLPEVPVPEHLRKLIA